MEMWEDFCLLLQCFEFICQILGFTGFMCPEPKCFALHCLDHVLWMVYLKHIRSVGSDKPLSCLINSTIIYDHKNWNIVGCNFHFIPNVSMFNMLSLRPSFHICKLAQVISIVLHHSMNILPRVNDRDARCLLLCSFTYGGEGLQLVPTGQMIVEDD